MLHREIECQNKTVDTSTIYKSKGAGLNDVPKVFLVIYLNISPQIGCNWLSVFPFVAFVLEL